MLCNYINDIYDNHIHIGLDVDERSSYSMRIEEHLFDLLNLLTKIYTNESILFIGSDNNTIWFTLDLDNGILTCNFHRIQKRFEQEYKINMFATHMKKSVIKRLKL